MPGVYRNVGITVGRVFQGTCDMGPGQTAELILTLSDASDEFTGQLRHLTRRSGISKIYYRSQF